MQGKCSRDAQILLDFKLDSHVPEDQQKPGTETLVSSDKCTSTLVNPCGDITEIFFPYHHNKAYGTMSLVWNESYNFPETKL